MDFSNIELILHSIGMVQCFFFMLVLWVTPSGPRKARPLLGAFIFFYGLTFVDGFIHHSSGYLTAPHFSRILQPFYFLIPPLALLYVRQAVSTQDGFNRRQLRPLFWWVIGVTILLLPFYGLDERVKLLLITEDMDGISLLFEQGNPADLIQIVLAIASLFIVLVGFDIQGLIFLWMLWKTIKKHNQNIRDIFSNIEDIDLRWIRDLILLLVVVWLVMVIFDVLAIVTDAPSGFDWISTAVEVIAIFVISLKGLGQSAISYPSIEKDQECLGPKPTAPMTEKTVANEPQVEKYIKSALGESEIKRILDKLLTIMNTEELYQDNMLTLPVLAKKIGVSVNYLSQAINQGLGLNFYDFVNQQRIKAAQKMLNDEQNTDTILAIAMQVGFNSKSTFNAAFKKFTSTTPASHKKQAVLGNAQK